MIIYRAIRYKVGSLQTGENYFTDKERIADYASDAVSALSSSGMINGMDDGSFAPLENATRAQAAVMIYRVISALL